MSASVHDPERVYVEAAEAIASADALLIGAGAGMGVDSGLPDFRGDQGFWKAYPACERLGLRFAVMASPTWFRRDPALAWGFYGHRALLYHRTSPHSGFEILRRWADGMRHGHFVFTSNVDGHFQKAGFDEDRVVEVHGSIRFAQCVVDCGAGIFPAPTEGLEVHEDVLRARDPLPACPQCGLLARPNVLMFGDWGWDGQRTESQHGRLADWLEALPPCRIAVVELGAGTAIPTVREFCQRVAGMLAGTLIRINPREPRIEGARGVGIATDALEGLTRIDRHLARIRG